MRPASMIITATLITAFGFIPAAPATAAPNSIPCTAGTPVPGDYDGDGGADLLVVVVSSDPLIGEGRLVRPSDGGAEYWLRIGEPLDSNVEHADLNGDVCADVVTTTVRGVSQQPVIIFGGTDGLSLATAKTLDLPQADRSAQPGSSLWPVISAIGIRHHGISQVVVSGVISVNESARDAFLDTYTLDSAGVPGLPVVTPLDVLGARSQVSLAGSGATVAVGASDMYVGPASYVGGVSDAGGVLIFSADPKNPSSLVHRTTITQDSRRVPGSAEQGDCFGASVSLRDGWLAIGVPCESIGKDKETGLVQPIRWDEKSSIYTAYRSIQQSTRGVPGSNEDHDLFGLGGVLVTRGLTAAGSYDITIGTPGEDLGRVKEAGSVTVANFTKAIYRSYTQNSKGLPDTAENADGFGSTLGALQSRANTDTLLIGAPYELNKGVEVGYAVRSDGRKLGSSTKWVALKPPAASRGTYQRWGYQFAG